MCNLFELFLPSLFSSLALAGFTISLLTEHLFAMLSKRLLLSLGEGGRGGQVRRLLDGEMERDLDRSLILARFRNLKFCEIDLGLRGDRVLLKQMNFNELNIC